MPTTVPARQIHLVGLAPRARRLLLKLSVKWISLFAFVCLVGCSRNQDPNKNLKSIDKLGPKPQAVKDNSEDSVGKILKK